MRVLSLTPYVTLAALVGTLACASNTARTEDPDETAAAQDTTTTTEQDTLTGQTETPPGYSGMEQDTTQRPEPTPTDTFLQNQGTGQPQDTAGYGGLERQDTTGQNQGQTGQTDTTGTTGVHDTTGMTHDTSGMTGDTTGTTGADTSANQGAGNQSGADTATAGDTTGYGTSQESGDSVSR
jgi:hypothetical protein